MYYVLYRIACVVTQIKFDVWIPFARTNHRFHFPFQYCGNERIFSRQTRTMINIYYYYYYSTHYYGLASSWQRTVCAVIPFHGNVHADFKRWQECFSR